MVPRIAFLFALALTTVQTIPASAATFLFIRHAESTANAQTATTVEEFIDPSLTSLGQQQALALADQLLGYNVTTIYTSAYQRTQLTIAPTAAAFDLTPITDARTNEWYLGDVTNLSELESVDYYSIMGGWAAGNTDAKAPLPNAESLDDMVARVLPAWQEIINKHKDEDGVVLLVGHGAEMGFVMPSFAENVDLDFAFENGLENTGIIEVELFGDKPYVTNWQGTELPVPSVPLPASGLLLFCATGALVAGNRKRAKRAA